MDERKAIIFPRQVLLIEIDRRCSFADCGTRVSIALTKQEAFGYSGFECVRCERWNNDCLSEKDIPDWWAELNEENIQPH